MTGAEMIAFERHRQVDDERWTAGHDDEHRPKELAAAGACYAWDYVNGPHAEPSSQWPWEAGWWKPTPDDPVRQLVKAGALIAAEIDRLQRAGAMGDGDSVCSDHLATERCGKCWP